jgi:hypothetical protein
MQITNNGTSGPGFEHQLKAALDAVVPPTPFAFRARYRSAEWLRSSRPWRIAPALLGAAAVVVMAVSAAAATSSPNPAVWTQRAVSTIQSVSHIPDNNPNPPENNAPAPRGSAPVTQPGGTSHATPPAARRAEPSDSPRPTERPDESPRPAGTPPPDDSRHPWPSPSPTPSDPHNPYPQPSPTPYPSPHDH